MSPRIVGESGVVLDVDAEMARGLVRDGFAKLADGEPESVLARPATAAATTIKPDGPSAANPEVGGTVTESGNSAPEIPNPDEGKEADGKPRGNASRDEWVAYALANGKTEDDLKGLTQTEIRALFKTEEE